ncbi:MAG: sigma-54-dependent Fis family transcriptional regulator [Kiritimatiellae bacterium]|nr:sigma-54-dependent Fis family transcriptional regulator [Kiritimatiellia bacterium]
MKHLLIVDDELGSRESLKQVFVRDYRVSLAADAAEALRILALGDVDLVLLDVLMPQRDGLSLLREIMESYAHVAVIMVSGSTSVRPVVESIQAGALDYLPKPFEVDDARRMVARALERAALKRKVEALQREVLREYPVQDIIGQAPSFLHAIETIRKSAESAATVLIEGESGTGKELMARLLHARSGRHDEPFVAVHCASLPETLMESELFGHEKGAFTSADRRRAGRFDMAGAGTIFFDEIGEMPLTTQVKLLRVLQEHEYMRVGGTQLIKTRARVVAATSRDLRAEVTAHRFRDDLFYRLNVVPVRLPPLRERREDIPLLLDHFLGVLRGPLNARAQRFGGAARVLIERYDWPGNVRELRNLVERALVLHGHQEELTPEALPMEIRYPPPSGGAAAPRSLEEAVNDFERRLVAKALAETGGVQTRAAERLGTTRRILRYRMDKLKISGAEG